MNQILVVALASVALAACVSLDVEEPGLPACAAQAVPTPAMEAGAVVQLFLNEGPGEFCSAVAIAPTLLLTAVNCVTPLLSKDDRVGYYPPLCTATGAAGEDGRFLFRYVSMTASTGSIELLSVDGTPFEAGVSRIFVSAAASTCMPDLAIIQTQLSLDVPVVPVRLEPAEHAEDEVVIIGLETTEDRLERQPSMATILEATAEDGSPTLPPRSLTLSGSSCAVPGGAVLAADTGALIGLIQTTDRTINCETATGSPRAARVAPYRQFLLEVARSTQTSLVAEFGSDAGGLMPSCPGN